MSRKHLRSKRILSSIVGLHLPSKHALDATELCRIGLRSLSKSGARHSNGQTVRAVQFVALKLELSFVSPHAFGALSNTLPRQPHRFHHLSAHSGVSEQRAWRACCAGAAKVLAQSLRALRPDLPQLLNQACEIGLSLFVIARVRFEAAVRTTSVTIPQPRDETFGVENMAAGEGGAVTRVFLAWLLANAALSHSTIYQEPSFSS